MSKKSECAEIRSTCRVPASRNGIALERECICDMKPSASSSAFFPTSGLVCVKYTEQP